MAETRDRVWFEFVESEIFSKQVRGLAEVLNRIQSDWLKTLSGARLLRERMAFAKPESPIRVCREERAGVTGTCIFI
jgi:hypothetical protein